ncbi:helix-turn-helix transcriptional regulator [Streptosporangium canum]|uniref:helix-turn-helix domain-containing protein n=1 Tax=Streptosporangium canum TaxID=324952 RepID=UPI0034120129
MSTDELIPSIGQVVGQNLLRLREHHQQTQSDVTREIFARTGQQWTRAQVSTLENGKREGIAFEELLVLAFTYDVPLAELFRSGTPIAGGDEETDFHVRAGGILTTMSAVRDALRGDKVKASAPRRSRGALLPSSIEADKAVAERLGLDTQAVANAAIKMWGRTLTEQRDARLGDTSSISPRTLQAKRGAMTRLLTAQIEAHFRVEEKR